MLLERLMEQIQETQSPVEHPVEHRIDWNKTLRWAFLATAIFFLVVLVAASIPYFILAKRVDRELAAGPFLHTYSFYAAPVSIAVGDQGSLPDMVGALRRAGLRAGNGEEPGTFTPSPDAVIIRTSTPVRVEFAGNQIHSITDLSNNRSVSEFDMPPQLITNLSDQGRARRIMVHYKDLPPVLVNAIVSIEDKRFFKHDGVDVLRIGKAFYVDLKERRKEQGASTITMQLARNLWLDRDKRWKRKIAEALITLHLEHKLTKKQILEYYANQVYLGGIGTFSINGFGEAAHAYFNKDIRNLTLTEAAMLAGLIQRPSYFNPLRYPDRTLERRNIVLEQMRDNKYITDQQYAQAEAAPLGLKPGVNELSETQYFIDIANDQLQHGMEEHERGLGNVYTTMDLRLQRAAERAVHDGMALVDSELAKSRKRGQPAAPSPQVALIALDPHTGDVKAVIGGRDYTASQLDRLLAKRPPGSAFKPFVYTAAINTALEGGQQVFTPASTILDAPATFQYDQTSYSPGNFKGQFMGQVTLRQALAHSLNVATVKLAQQVGYDRVVALAHRAGLNDDIKPTPAVALGAYQVTPLEIAGAYTMFGNSGVRVKPNFVSSVRTKDGDTLYETDQQTYPTIDPRVAFIMTDMMEEVLRSGTAAGVRARGFKLPAAGKTGTSHDGWFAGYTSRLLCVVWVGYDDYRELGLEGARSALPIWAEFMTEAARYRDYRDVKPFTPPAGVVKESTCGGASEYFIEGTQPPPCPEPDHVFFPAGAEADRAIPPNDGQDQGVVPVADSAVKVQGPMPARTPSPQPVKNTLPKNLPLPPQP